MNMNQIWARFMNIDRKIIVRELLFATGFLIVYAVALMGALMVHARFNDGASAFFSGGPLIAGTLVTGPEPDWSAMRIRLIELQLLDPPTSRRVQAVAYDGKLYTNSHYMGGIKQLLWKRWPGQAERDGRTVIRLCSGGPGGGPGTDPCGEGDRYERQLVRVKLSPETADIVKAVTAGFNGPRASYTPELVESGVVWLFELAPRNTTGASG